MAVPRAGPGYPCCSCLVLCGEMCWGHGLVKRAVSELKRGFGSWEVDPSICNLDDQLKLFVSRHSATFSPEIKGQRSLHHAGDTLETLVLINPSKLSVCDEIRKLICHSSHYKLLILTGPFLEDTGDVLLQSGGGFSIDDFIHIFTDKEIGETLGSSDPTTRFPEPHSLLPLYHRHYQCMWTLLTYLVDLLLRQWMKSFSSGCVLPVMLLAEMILRGKSLPERFWTPC